MAASGSSKRADIIEQRNQAATVFVGSISDEVDEDLLYELMVQVGRIVSVSLPKDPARGGHRGYGFVEYQTELDAEYATKVMNMVRLFGRPIRVTRSDTGSSDGKGFRDEGVGAKLWIGGLSPEVDEKVLHDTFSAFGALNGDAHIARDPATGNSRGFGFCSYETFESSDLAIEAMHGRHLCGRPIQVQYAMKPGSRERHGSQAERMLAAAKKPERTLQPHTMFAASPDEPVQAPQSAGRALAGVAAQATARPDVAVAGAGGVGTGVATAMGADMGMNMGMGVGPTTDGYYGGGSVAPHGGAGSGQVASHGGAGSGQVASHGGAGSGQVASHGGAGSGHVGMEGSSSSAGMAFGMGGAPGYGAGFSGTGPPLASGPGGGPGGYGGPPVGMGMGPGPGMGPGMGMGMRPPMGMGAGMGFAPGMGMPMGGQAGVGGGAASMGPPPGLGFGRPPRAMGPPPGYGGAPMGPMHGGVTSGIAGVGGNGSAGGGAGPGSGGMLPPGVLPPRPGKS